jgi:hypothetical protein
MRPDFPNYLTVAVKALLNASNHKDKDLSLTAVECLNKAINVICIYIFIIVTFLSSVAHLQ